jgi:hypothetical protein
MHTHTITGVFENHDQARKAVRELMQAGFSEAQIGVASSHRETIADVPVSGKHAGESFASEGAITGVAAGAGLGALWGLGIAAGMLTPIGPALLGGSLAALLSSAAAGAAAAGLAGALVGMGIPREEAAYYESEMAAGHTIITVSAGERGEDAQAILRRYGGHDMAARVSAAMETLDQGPAPIAPPPNTSDDDLAVHPNAPLTHMPLSPEAAKEEASGFKVSPAPTFGGTTSDHVTFKVPVAHAPVTGMDTTIDEEANMPPVAVDVPVKPSPLEVEELPHKRL